MGSDHDWGLMSENLKNGEIHIVILIEPGRDASPEAKKNFLKYEFPLSSYKVVGSFNLNGLAEGTVPKNIGNVVEMRIHVIGHNSENWVMLSEVNCRKFNQYPHKYKVIGTLLGLKALPMVLACNLYR